MGGQRPGRRLAHRRRGQTTLEFAFVAPLFFLCFFGSIDAALWAVQTGASVSAAEQATRLAAAAAGSPQSQSTPTPPVILEGIRTQLQQAMFGTTVKAWCDPRGGPCPTPTDGARSPFSHCPTTPADVEQRLGARVVAVCVDTSPSAPACPSPPTPPTPRCDDPPTVTVHVIGYLASLVPPMFGLGWHAGEIPVDIVATTHTLRFVR